MASRLYGGDPAPAIDSVNAGESTMAGRLFGGDPAPAADVTPETEPVVPLTEQPTTTNEPEAQPAERTFDEVLPAAIKALREGDVGRRMYDTIDPSIAAAMPNGDEEGAYSPAVKAELSRQFSRMATDMDLDGDDVQAITIAARQIAATPADAAAIAALRVEHRSAIDALNNAFGEDARAAFDAALLLVKRDPRTAAWLDRSRAGDDPQVIVRICRRALAAKRSGRL